MAQHKVQLVPAHHQHRNFDARIVEVIELLFDRLDGSAQRPFETRALIQAKLFCALTIEAKCRSYEPNISMMEAICLTSSV